jgi:aminoacyl tRNA synthase complex-interacting multifunctional protein 1
MIASRLRSFYKTEELEGLTVVVLLNLKARNLVGFPSHGMVLCASNDDHTQVKLVTPPETAKVGERHFVPRFGDETSRSRIQSGKEEAV